MKTLRTKQPDSSSIAKFAALSTILFSFAAYADEPSISGLYSNMNLSGEEDIAGMEMFIVGSREGYFVTVQCSQGEPAKPVLTQLAVNGLKISGNIPDSAGCDGKSFQGIVGKNELDVVFDKSKKHLKLIAGKSFWLAK